MLFNKHTFVNVLKSFLGLNRAPVYVQFYITSRCNLTCKQCNIIYANAAVRETTAEEIDKIAENLRKIGTTIVLLTGGEPFLRKDLPEIIKSFTKRNIHVRTQTNGFASKPMLESVVSAGARDISISLDSLIEKKQDFLNGSFDKSWHRAIETISLVTQTYPVKNSFAAFGTVLSPHNILEIPNIIRFATRIGWYVSLVPAHITDPTNIFNFRSYDKDMIFDPESYPVVDHILRECIKLKQQGYNLYDSPEYLMNISSFIKGKQLRWRRRNHDVCDSPNLYFAIRPNGDIQPCCDHVLNKSYPVWHDDFPDWFKEKIVHQDIYPLIQPCTGCMYGSFPEITITMRYPLTAFSRFQVFFKARKPKPWPLTTQQIIEIIEDINRTYPSKHNLPDHLQNLIPQNEEAILSSIPL